MSVDYNTRLDALREMHTLLQQKEPVPETVAAAASMKPNARLKDVEKEIASIKKMVSKQVKTATNEAIEKDYEQIAREHNMTLEEFKKTVLNEGKDKKVLDIEARAIGQKKMERERDGARQKKDLERLADQGAFKMEVDYV